MISGLVSSSSIKNDNVAAVVSCPVKTMRIIVYQLHEPQNHDDGEVVNLPSDEQGYRKEIQAETVASLTEETFVMDQSADLFTKNN